MKKVLIFFSALVLGLAVFSYMKDDPEPDVAENKGVESVTQISIRGESFTAIVRDDPTSRAMGLSGRPPLRKDEAMVFAFPNEGLWGIWMKDMNFSIDILWLDEDQKVVHVEKNVSPETYPNIFFPREEALYVIELSAGTVDDVGASVGDRFIFVGGIPVGK